MLFNSIEFLIFFIVTFIIYWALSEFKLKWQNLFILIASYIFYGWWSWKFLCLLAFSTLLDYVFGLLITDSDGRKKKLYLWLTVISNVGVLAIFKYYDFFVFELKQSLSVFGILINPVLLNFALPVGISFYTFHGMSYVFDVYRNKQIPVRSFIDYGVFVSFFPLLVAGPIERANHLIPQIQSKRFFNYVAAVEGARLVLWGLFKKVAIADTLAPFVDEVFTNSAHLDGYALMLGALAFSIQIYGDFSGYSDIALGVSKMLGFELLTNFRFPYFSRDIAEFWRRWHISLSSWFRDYLYIPLGGSRSGKWKAVRNTFLIFLLSGFWHGASWNFIIWGSLHALAFLPLFLMKKNRINVGTVIAEGKTFPNFKELFQVITTFIFVTFTWIFFRETSINQAWSYCTGIFIRPWNLTNVQIDWPIVFLVSILFSFDWLHRMDPRLLYFSKRTFVRYGVYTMLMILILIFIFQNDHSAFIYFQF